MEIEKGGTGEGAEGEKGGATFEAKGGVAARRGETEK